MRTDITVRSEDGSEQNIAIDAPPGTPFGVVVDALTRVVGCTPRWSGARRLHPGMAMGADPLARGAVLSVGQGEHPPLCGSRLEIVGGADCGRAVPLDRAQIDIGRGEGCTLTLADPHVSRRHALLSIGSTSVRLHDLGSTHGTYVDGRRLHGTSVLRAEVPVRVGDTTLMLRTGTVREVEAPAGEPIVVEVPAAPGAASAAPRIQWAAALVPALAGAGFAALMHSAQFLAFAALSPVAFLLSTVVDRRRARRARRTSAELLRDERSKMQREVADAVRREAARRRQTYPDAGILLRSVTTPWRRGQPLRARLGLADLPSETLLREAGHTQPAATIPAVPYVLDLTEAAVAIVAAPDLRRGIARWMVVQLAARISPDDLEFALFTRHPDHWRWMCWLPHLRERVSCDEPEQQRLAAEVAELAESRRVAWSGRWVLLILDGASTVPGIERVNDVLADGPGRLGITALNLDERQCPPGAGGLTVVTACQGDRGTVRVGTTDVLADRIELGTAERLARSLARSSQARTDTALPDVVELTTLLGDDDICADVIGRRWLRDEQTAGTPVGVAAHGTVSVDLERDGPHALIAGTTGSGKSELLQTLVVGLAARHPPDDITFLLVDYKGGAAFADCAALPHTVGVVTDLDQRLTRRVLASLDSEIRRRERLFATEHVPHLRAYRCGGRRLPRLVLVVDEFATLADELPEFVPGLVSIAQRGRSLGVHLVLATQRPSGAVSPQIRANTALRIALRTASAAESIDVIDVPDAAGIDRRTPGRACLRTGTALFSLQCARVTGPAPTSGIEVTVLDQWRRPVAGQRPERDDRAQLRYLSAIRAAARDYPAPRRPWLPPLPWPLHLEDLTSPPAGAAFGLVDLPAEQRQEPLLLDVARGESFLFTGSPGSGRSSALLALAGAAAFAHPPDDVHVHGVDWAGSGLAGLSALPHLGTRLSTTNGMDLVARLVVLLEREAERRKPAPPAGPAILFVLDGWEEFAAASDEYDNGRTAGRVLTLLRAGPSARITIAVSGARATLAPRVANLFANRFVLRMHDPGDYALAGVAARTFPEPAQPGRGVRVRDGAEVQLALADPARRPAWPAPGSAPLLVRALPQRVSLDELTDTDGTILGVGGDAAAPIAVELTVGAGRMLVAGPARSGRSTLLRTILAQVRDGPVVVAAPARSPLADAASRRRVRLVTPSDSIGHLDPETLVLVDDCEAFADTVAGAALLDWLVTTGRRAVVAGRSDAAALDYRGLAAEARRHGCGVLLRPGALDGALLAVRLPPGHADLPPGRGVLVPDPAWRLGEEPLTIQVACP